MRAVWSVTILAILAATAGCAGGSSGGGAPQPVGTTASGTSAPATSAPTGSGATTAPASASSPSSSAASPGASGSATSTPVPGASPATPLPTPTAMLTPEPGLLGMAATSSDAFVSTMGVDVDLLSPPASEQSSIASAFTGLGVRQTRIAITEPNATYQNVVKSFYAANPGVAAFGLTDCSPPLGASSTSDVTAADVSSFISATGAKFDYIEGVNEPDDRGDTTWFVDTRTCLAPLANGVDGIPLAAPSLVTQLNGPSEMDLGSLSGEVEATNVHRYFNGHNPGTAGYGSSDSCGAYGSLAWSICWGQYNDSSVPTVVTETGWNSQTEVDEATQAKYTERVFLVDAAAGIPITSLYTLLSYTGGDAFGGDGLLRTDLSQKPAYSAVANMTKLLADPGSAFSTSPLLLGVSPTASTSGTGLRMMLLEKRSGTYELALWQEVQSATPGSYGTDTPPQAISATIAVGGLYTGTIHAWQDDGSAPTTSLGLNVFFTVPVTDRLTVLELVPYGG